MQSASHQRTQNLLLISKLLDCRDNASLFTLVIDSIEQSSKPLIRQYVAKAKATSTAVIFISFETLRPPPGCHEIIHARKLSLEALQKQIRSACLASPKSLVIIDTLHNVIASSSSVSFSQWLSSLIAPTVNLVAVYHSSLPLMRTTLPQNSYQPHPLTLLRFLATTIFTTHSLSHTIAAKAATDRSHAPPLHGLDEDGEGTVQGLGANDVRGLVVQCEMRRRSGRTIDLSFVLSSESFSEEQKRRPFAGITLLDDHPLYRKPISLPADKGYLKDESEHGELSFNLNLTEQQKRDREGVVLPYFDAQVEGGNGEGGRILYDMGSEDDFDDEEDEM